MRISLKNRKLRGEQNRIAWRIFLLNSELHRDILRIQSWILTEEDGEVEDVEEAGRQLPLHQITAVMAPGLKDITLTKCLHGEVWEDKVEEVLEVYWFKQEEEVLEVY